MKNNYLVLITWNDPYPKQFEFRVGGSSMAVGIAKAVRMFRKEQKGRKINELIVKIIKL